MQRRGLQILKWLGTFAVFFAFVLLIAWKLIGGGAGVVEAALPEFPVLPAPSQALAPDAAGLVYFPTSTPFDLDVILAGMEHALPTTGVGTLIMPESASADTPVPAMILLHGSGGITPGREMETGELLAANGIAAFVVDYYLPRGVTQDVNYMLRVLSVTEFDAAADAYAALQLLATHPAIDASRVGVMGFSYGGMAARIAMDERIRRVLSPRHQFAAFADFYGPCFQHFGTEPVEGVPLLTLRGNEDASNDLAACVERESELRALGVAVESYVFEGAGHAWEADMPRKLYDSPYVQGCTIRYDAEGHSSIDGHSIVNVPVDTSRPERIAVRIASGTLMADCVKSGYVIGRDDETRKLAEARLLGFLGRVF